MLCAFLEGEIMSEYFETTIVLGAGVLTLFNLIDKKAKE